MREVIRNTPMRNTMLLSILSLALIAVTCKKSDSTTGPATPAQAITIASGFGNTDTLIFGGNAVAADRTVGPYNLTQFDSVRIKFTAAPIGTSQPLSFYVYFGVNYLLADTLSSPRSYAKVLHKFDIVRPDSVAVRFSDFTYNTIYMKLYNFSLIGWEK
jgi:hypothetical protein